MVLKAGFVLEEEAFESIEYGFDYNLEMFEIKLSFHLENSKKSEHNIFKEMFLLADKFLSRTI